MSLLLLGLLLFIAPHAVRIVADDWRTQTVARIGLLPWKGVISVISLLGLALIVVGYGQARLAPVVLWTPPTAMKHLAALLTLAAFILLAAAYVPGNALKAAVGHPMVLAVKTWALAHLLSNGTLADLLLFGSLLAWAVLSFMAARRRDRAAGTVAVRGPALRLVVVVIIGVVAWALFAFWLHSAWIGVRPFGR